MAVRLINWFFCSIFMYLYYSVSTNTINNATSARISIPSIIKHEEGAILPYQWRTPLRSTAPYWLSALYPVTLLIRPMG